MLGRSDREEGFSRRRRVKYLVQPISTEAALSVRKCRFCKKTCFIIKNNTMVAAPPLGMGVAVCNANLWGLLWVTVTTVVVATARYDPW
jgi:hypothetical protein